MQKLIINKFSQHYFTILVATTIFYLGIGPAIWLASFLKPIIFWPLFIALTFLGFLALPDIKLYLKQNQLGPSFNITYFSISAMLSFGLTLTMGFSRFFSFTGDWTVARWDLYLFLSGSQGNSFASDYALPESAVIRHYLGFYLPPAFLLKTITFLGEFFNLSPNFLLVRCILFFWIAIGIFLALLLLQKYLIHPRYLVGFFFVFFGLSGLDIIGALLTKGSVTDGYWSIEWWAQFFNYLSPLTAFYFPTNHLIFCILAISLYFALPLNVMKNFVVLLFMFGLHWTPICTFALLTAYLLHNRRKFDLREIRVKSWLSLFILSLFTLPYLVYLQLDPGILRFKLNGEISLKFISLYLLFLFLEFLLIYMLNNRSFKIKIPRFIPIALTLLPLFKAGAANDLVTRFSLPFLIIIYFIFSNNLLLFVKQLGPKIKSNRNFNVHEVFTLLFCSVFFTLSSLNPLVEFSSRLAPTFGVHGNINSAAGPLDINELSQSACLRGKYCRASGVFFANYPVMSNQMWASKKSFKDSVLTRLFLRDSLYS